MRNMKPGRLNPPDVLGDFVARLNDWGSRSVPFFFLIDFEMEKPVAMPLSKVDPSDVLYNFNGISNVPRQQARMRRGVKLKRSPMSLAAYQAMFDKVQAALKYGDSFLANLTVPTEVRCDATLKDIFMSTRARYNLWFRDEFVVFSPETFLQIKDGTVYAFPMKGTIDASVPDARQRILSDAKEMAEHVTIVDLIRNDLSRVATNVRVNRFRYIEELATNEKRLLQVSSEIAGALPSDYRGRLGDLLVRLLPAGSVSGAPKEKTVAILRSAEQRKRGYYTGIAGIFDGANLDTCVLIRYIESDNGKLFYRSGGGITTQSIVEMEYEEVIDKVYVPVG